MSQFMPIHLLNSSRLLLNSPVTRFRSCHTEPLGEMNAQKEKIKQSQEYFDQYIEEYYETDDIEDEGLPVKTETIEEQLNVDSIDGVISLLKRERVRDIVVLFLGKDGPGIVDTMVICSPFNARHGAAVSEVLRKSGKQKDEQPRKCAIRHSFGWFQIELGKIQVHVMGEDIRRKFDLESLWCLQDEVDGETPFIPPQRSIL